MKTLVIGAILRAGKSVYFVPGKSVIVQTSSVSIVLPVYNQESHIQEVVEDYYSALSRVLANFEIVLVINNCRDKSLERCRELEQKYPNVVRTVVSEKGGWGRAVKLGLKEARGDYLCYTNSARTAAKDLVLLVLYAIANPGNVVKANRKIRDGMTRRLGSLLYNLECRALFDLSYWDINGTPKVFPRECMKLLELGREDDLIDAEFNYICRQQDYPVLEVPIFSFRRHSGKSTTNFGSAFKMYWGAVQLYRDKRNEVSK